MYRLAAEGKGVIVADSLAQIERLQLGDRLEIHAPYGTLRLPIVGIVVDYSDQQGAILLDRSIFIEYWRDDTVNAFRVYRDKAVGAATVRQRIIDRYSGRRRVFVLTNGELKRYILTVVDQWFSLTSVQIVVSVFVAILGVVNTLTVSITDRKRELGVLRAVGALRAQIRTTIWIEALCIAALGIVLGCALGAVNLYYILQIAQHDVIGTRLAYVFPTGTALSLVPIMFVAAFWLPRCGRRSRPSEGRWWRRSSMSRQLADCISRHAGRVRHFRSGFVAAGLVVVALTAVPSPYVGMRAVVAAEDARQIAVQAQKKAEAKSEKYEGLLQSFSADGKMAEKRWTFEQLGSHGQSKSTIRFTAPAEVKGVVLLIFNHPDKASDQWMWTPAIERDRRIALQDRSTRFFGTDFSFEDLEERDVDQFDYTLLGDDTIARTRPAGRSSPPPSRPSRRSTRNRSSGSARTTTRPHASTPS